MSTTAATDPASAGIGDLADVLAIEAVALADRGLPAGVHDAVARAAAADPIAPALRFVFDATRPDRTRALSYEQLERELWQTANALREAGAGRDDAVAILLPNLPDTLLAVWGATICSRANPINPLLEAEQIAAIARAAGATVMVTLAPIPGSDLHEKAVAAAAMVPGLRRILTVDITHELPWPKRLVARAARAARRSTPAAAVPVVDFETVRRAASSRPAFEVDERADRVCALFHTGGTTGAPKLGRLTTGNLVSAMWSAGRNLPAGTLGPGASMCCGLPLFHVNGVLVGSLLPWMEGGCVLLGPPQGYRAPGMIEGFWRIVERHRITVFTAIPTIYAALLEAPSGGFDTRSLRYGVCGAAPMPRELLERFERERAVKVIEAYGMTEAACASTMNPGRGERRLGSVGLRIAYQELKVVDLGATPPRPCAPGEVGTVLLRGPNVFAGYVDPADEDGLWVDLDDGGAPWLCSGDLGRLDADGYLWLTGRAKELIIRGGHNIDPRVIETALEAHPMVAMAAAVGRPDRRVGELPVAYVQLRPGADVSATDLLSHARAHVAEPAAVPKAVHVVDALPVPAIGKPYKPELSRREAEAAVRDALAGDGVAAVRVDALQDIERGLVVEVHLDAGLAAEQRRRARELVGGFALTVSIAQEDV